MYTWLPLSGNSGRLTWVRPQQPQEQRYPVLHVHAGSIRVSVIHRTLTWPTGSLTWSFLRVRIHTNTESAQHLDSEKLLQLLCVLLTGFEPQVFGSLVRRSTNWATPSPFHCPEVQFKMVSMFSGRPIHFMRSIPSLRSSLVSQNGQLFSKYIGFYINTRDTIVGCA